MRRVAFVVCTLVLGVAVITAHAQPALETVKVTVLSQSGFFESLGACNSLNS